MKQDVFVFHKLGMFDTWDKLKVFIEHSMSFLVLSAKTDPEIPSWSVSHARYRFSVTFLEFLLMTGMESPHKVLNEYIEQHIGCLPHDRGEPFTKDEPDLQMDISVIGFNWKRLEAGEYFPLLVPLQLTSSMR